MRYYFLLFACCCLLSSCANDTERDKKIEAAIRADLERTIVKINSIDTSLHDHHQKVDSLLILTVEPIATSKDIVLRIDDRKKRIEHIESFKQEAEDSLDIAIYKKELDSLQEIKLTEDKAAGYHVRIRYVISSKQDGYMSHEHMYLVTEDMQVTNCHD